MRTSYKAVPSRNVMVGVGSALMDICLLESDSFLRDAGARKGGMILVNGSRIPELLGKTGKKPVLVPGGSACNTTLGVGKLGGRARFIGKKGNDEWGLLFESGLRKHNVEPVLSSSSTPTGHVLSIITPDAQRSMLTFLGAAAEMTPSEITGALFRNAALVHIEGYMLFNRELMLSVIDAATRSGAALSLDLSSYTVVEESGDFLRMIIEKYVDILIANEDEARAFTGKNDEEKSCDALSRFVDIAVVKIGARGSLIASRGSVTRVQPLGGGAPVVDTTGAGDLWASGFLFGLLEGFTIERCGMLGSACGFEVCQVVGAAIPEEGWQRIRELL
ncbi:MAG: adenosine kinase [Chitinispirillaceae bacterium]|nr:adenosine kinase [Chitinispirillaceae bacterium]